MTMSLSMPKPVPLALAEISDREASEMALFLVRIFGDDAGTVAAERAAKSEQKADWRRVRKEVEKLLLDEAAASDEKPLRLFG
jgi:hypothetical protein